MLWVGSYVNGSWFVFGGTWGTLLGVPREPARGYLGIALVFVYAGS